jgi:hypothetical protein
MILQAGQATLKTKGLIFGGRWKCPNINTKVVQKL